MGAPNSIAGSTTTVVNVRLHQFDAYIGRRSSCPSGFRGEGADGAYGNPFPVQKYGRDALRLFRDYFSERVDDDFEFRRRVLLLKGKRLGCFCVDQGGAGDCHGRVIVEFLETRQQ
jgi:hypothetical protein